MKLFGFLPGFHLQRNLISVGTAEVSFSSYWISLNLFCINILDRVGVDIFMDYRVNYRGWL
jgi:hypothetical protein